MSKITRERYTSVYRAMLDYTLQQGMKMETMTEVDTSVSKYLEHLYMDGEDTPMGNYVVAALCFHRPELKGNQNLPKTLQALKGWRKLSPARSRMPIPYEVVALLATYALRQGQEQVALVLHAPELLPLPATFGIPRASGSRCGEAGEERAGPTSGGASCCTLQKWGYPRRQTSGTSL